jgi:hypothetical protein
MIEQRREHDETPPLWDDPVVEEVRAIRRKLWEASGRNIRRFIDQSRQAAQQRRAGKPREGTRDVG